MYCRKCGKQIDYDAPLCKECQETELFFSEPKPALDFQNLNPQPTFTSAPDTYQGNRKEGFGGALTATILGSIAFFISLIAMSVMSALLEEMLDETLSYYYEIDWSIVVVFLIVSLGLAIPALILGIKSMKCFFRAKNAGRIKPVATLACGIVGLAMGAMAIAYGALTFLMLLAV